MSGKTIRQSKVLKALTEKHAGVLRVTGRNDVILTLLNSMNERYGKRVFLQECLDRLTDEGKLIIERTDGRITLIAVPEALENASTNDESEADMPAPKGMHMTTYARDSRGRELPAALSDQHASPLEVSYINPETGKAIIAAGELALEQLREGRKSRLNREEVLATIQGVLATLYDNQPEVVAGMVTPVFHHLVDSRHLRRLDDKGRPTSRRNIAVTYELDLAEKPPLTKDAAIARLMSKVETLTDDKDRLTAENKALKEKLAAATKQQVNQKLLEKITTRLEEAQATITRLQAELETLKRSHETALNRLKTAHRRELDEVHTTHTTELATVQQKFDAADAEKRELERQLREAQSSDQINPDLEQRLRKLNIEL